jgi:hypothetical protein
VHLPRGLLWPHDDGRAYRCAALKHRQRSARSRDGEPHALAKHLRSRISHATPFVLASLGLPPRNNLYPCGRGRPITNERRFRFRFRLYLSYTFDTKAVISSFGTKGKAAVNQSIGRSINSGQLCSSIKFLFTQYFPFHHIHTNGLRLFTPFPPFRASEMTHPQPAHSCCFFYFSIFFSFCFSSNRIIQQQPRL